MPSASSPAGPGAREDFMQLTVHERRMRLIAAAGVLLEHHDPVDVTIERVAAQAGTSVGSVRHYYPLQRGLHLAALANAVDDLGERVLPHLDLPAHEAALQSVLTYMDWIDERPVQFRRVMTAGLAQPGVRDLIVQVRDQTVRMVLGELYYSAVEQAPAAIVIAVTGWLSALNTAMLLRLDLGGPPAAELGRQLVDTLAGAVRAAGDADAADRLLAA